MLGAVDMMTGTVLAMLKHGAVITIEMTAVTIAHPVLLTIDRMLLVLDTMRLARRHAPVSQTVIDAMLLIDVALIDGLRLRGTRGDPDPNHGGNNAIHRLHICSPSKGELAVVR
jgi:hypothetical protein